MTGDCCVFKFFRRSVDDAFQNDIMILLFYKFPF